MSLMPKHIMAEWGPTGGFYGAAAYTLVESRVIFLPWGERLPRKI